MPNDRSQSLLLAALKYDGFEMPPAGKLPDDVISDFETLIDMGAPDPRDEPLAAVDERTIDVVAGRTHWSYRWLAPLSPPEVKLSGWVRNDIDRFILAKQEEAGLKPAPEGAKAALARRVFFDLIGLPLSPEELQRFRDDTSADAYEKLVDRLLASPHYGERMAIGWLDVVRFADTIGYHSDNPRNVWPYRDYVIRAFNDNKPFDRFTIEQLAGDPENATRIAQYEMAFAMQASVPELMDTKGESATTLELYGFQPGDGSFASNCLLARRLAVRGVRFIQLYHKDWDHHGGVKAGIAYKAQEIDRACMALITDLKNRGMLDSTLIVWAGGFGRTPMSQGVNGRDHHNKAITVWLAGGGIKGGVVHGSTDELGYAAVENVCTVHDLHATMLTQLGIRHDAFSVKFQGLDAKLTGVERARVLTDIIA